MSDFVPAHDREVTRLIADYPLAWILSRDGDGLARTVLPLLGEIGTDGKVASLFGHYARRNPQVAALERDGRVTVLFNGPQGYVSPDLVSKPDWGPTWNYATVSIDGVLRFVPAENHDSLTRLAAHLEGEGADAWTVARMGKRYQPMMQAIVAFRIIIERTHAVFKLGQDESATAFGEIVERHDNRSLAAWMRNNRRPGGEN